MPTTNVGFLKVNNAVLIGSAVAAAGAVEALNGVSASQIAAAGYGTRLDAQAFDLSVAGYAKNAAVAFTLTGTTGITIDLTALAAATGVVVAGDTVFASFNQLILVNTGAADLIVAPGGSNPARLPLNGTTPTYTVPAGSRLVIESAAGLAVDSTHKTILVTPATGGSLGLCVGGA